MRLAWPPSSTHRRWGVLRAIEGPEERLETARVFEPRPDARCAKAHRILDLVTRHARAAVRAEGLEEGIAGVEERAITSRVGRVRSIRVREDLSVRDWRLRRQDEYRRTVEAQVNGRASGGFVAPVDTQREAVGGHNGSSDGTGSPGPSSWSPSSSSASIFGSGARATLHVTKS